MARPDDLELLTAFIDGELDAVASLEMQRRIEAEPELAKQYSALKAMSDTVGATLRIERASPSLHERVGALAGEARRQARPRFALPGWAGLLAAACVGAVLATGTTYSIVKQYRGSEITDTVVAAHLRGLLAQHPVDVGSSDRHTVKPWFNERLPFAPIVPEETIPGFTLLGGRLDIVGGEPAGTVVYQHRSHLVSITQSRAADQASTPRQTLTREGLTVIRWRRGGIAFVLVTDLPAAELGPLLAVWP